MHAQAYLAVGIFLVLGLRTLAMKVLARETKKIRKGLYYKNLITDHMERLDRWQQVRPFMHRGYCGYARSLILEMIEAYEFLLNHKYETDHEVLHILRRLLFEFPPDYDPPAIGGSFLTQYIKQKPA